MSQYNQLNSPEIETKQNNDNITPLKVEDDIDIKQLPKSSKKSKSKKSKKSKSKSSRKLRSKNESNSDYHSLNAYTSHSSKYPSLDEKPFHPKRAQTTHNCLTQTAPFNAINPNNNKQNLQLNADLIEEQNQNGQQNQQQQHHEDASNLAYPINPFDHLMPHKNDYGTPNMAWIGDDGLVHTPQGGVYAKTTEAIANFRRELKYDSGWHRTRQRYICLILLIMFLTLCAVVVLLIARDVIIVDANIINGSEMDVWNMDNCTLNQNIAQGCNVTIKTILDIKINNKNWVPATINNWNVKHKFYCARSLDCLSQGTEFGTDPMINDGSSEVARKKTGSVTLNETETFKLYGCTVHPTNATFCAWERSCKFNDSNNEPPGHFVLSLTLTAELSFALQSSTEISTIVRLGTDCNGTAIVCQVGENVKNSGILCE